MPEPVKRLSGTLTGTRTSCLTGAARTVILPWYVYQRSWAAPASSNPLTFQLDDGPTGYESFCLDEGNANLRKMAEKGWTACFGTDGRWDRLEISATEMARVLAELQRLL